MDPEETALAGTLEALTTGAGGGGAAQVLAAARARAAVAAAMARDGGLREAFDRAEREPGDPVAVGALAAALLRSARASPEFAADLRAWAAERDPGGARPADPASGERAHTAGNAIGGAARLTGPTVQAGAISGGVHFHHTPAGGPAASPELPVPSQLPRVPAHFTGRGSDLAALDALRPARLVVVSGPPGVGKTVLAAHWLHGLRETYRDGQLYVDLRAYAPGGPAGPGEVLGGFLRAFGMTHVPADPVEQAALWRSVAADRRIAVLLDNAASAAQVRPLLPGAPDCLVVVVSRRRLTGLGVEGAAFHPLEVLAADTAVELLTRRVGEQRVARERDAAHQVAALCAGLPLAVCLAGARMAARPRQPLAAMALALQQEADRLAMLRTEGELALETALDDSYAALAPDAARAYRLLALDPAPDFGRADTAAACAVPEQHAAGLLDDLAEANLLEELGPDRYRFHDLVRLHALRRAETGETAAERDTVLRRVLDRYLATATAAEALLSPTHRTLRRDYGTPPPAEPRFPGPEAALDWLDRRRVHLTAAVKAAVRHGLDATAWQLVDAMQPLFLRLRPYDLWVETHRIGRDAAHRAGHPEGVNRMLTTGASGLLGAGLHDEAAEWFGLALTDARERGDRRAEAQAVHRRGQAAYQAGRLAEARADFARALDLRTAIGYERGAALSRVCLGEIALDEGRPAEAAGLLGAAHATLVAVRDRYDAARAEALLGLAHARLGDPDRARALLDHALTEFAWAGSAHWQGRTLEIMGRAAEEHGDTAVALGRFTQAVERYTTASSPSDIQRLRDRISRLGTDRDPGSG
jgi:tetratricopeptide (TPR) repeat protein